MNVGEVMTRDVRLVDPDQSINEVARIMASLDTGSVPVGENDRLVGMVTDRDIAIRAVAAGKGPDTPVRDVMTQGVKYCFEDEDVADVAENMAKLQLRRLPVRSARTTTTRRGCSPPFCIAKASDLRKNYASVRIGARPHYSGPAGETTLPAWG
ncbi:MAG: CBS domain-containing protein [Burkholderiales bacterium]|nr:CBS domain-containing protein [Burkholderiales bacterium]